MEDIKSVEQTRYPSPQTQDTDLRSVLQWKVNAGLKSRQMEIWEENRTAHLFGPRHSRIDGREILVAKVTWGQVRKNAWVKLTQENYSRVKLTWENLNSRILELSGL